MLRSVLMVLVFVALGVPGAILGIPWSLLQGNTRTMYGWAKRIIQIGLKVAGVRVQAQGFENLPTDRSCILLSNHVSNMDPPVLFAVVPGMLSFFLKRELMSIPLLGTAMKMGKFVPVERSHSREDARRSTEAAGRALQSGLHIMVFPEGTRSPNGRLLPFKKGAFFLAEATGAPIVPVVVHGTAAMMPKGTNALLPGTAVVQFLPAVEPRDYAGRDELMRAVRGAMERALEEGAAGTVAGAQLTSR